MTFTEDKAAVAALAVLLETNTMNEIIAMKEEDAAVRIIYEDAQNARIRLKRRENPINTKMDYDKLSSFTDEELLGEARESLSTDDGVYHRKYSPEELNNEDLQTSEREAALDAENSETVYKALYAYGTL